MRRWGLLLAICVLAALPAAAQRAAAPQSYPVSAFVIEYPLPHPDLPPISALLDLEVEMRVTRGGLMQPHPTTENVRFHLDAVPPGTRIWDTGLLYLNRQILGEFERRGEVVQLGLRSIAAGTLASFSTACVAGMLL